MSLVGSRLIKFTVSSMTSSLYFCSGESMENALRACCKGIKIGKILIHREGDNGQQVCTYYAYVLVLMYSTSIQWKRFFDHKVKF